MLMKKHLLLIAALLVAPHLLQAQDLLRVTTVDGTTQDVPLADLQKITFSDDETMMDVVLVSGEVNGVMLSDLRYITFEDSGTDPTGVADVRANGDVAFAIVGGAYVRVTSPSPLKSVDVYDTSGRTLFHQVPQVGTRQVDIPLKGLTSGVSIVAVENGQGFSSRKFSIK